MIVFLIGVMFGATGNATPPTTQPTPAPEVQAATQPANAVEWYFDRCEDGRIGSIIVSGRAYRLEMDGDDWVFYPKAATTQPAGDITISDGTEDWSWLLKDDDVTIPKVLADDMDRVFIVPPEDEWHRFQGEWWKTRTTQPVGQEVPEGKRQ